MKFEKVLEESISATSTSSVVGVDNPWFVDWAKGKRKKGKIVRRKMPTSIKI